MLNTVIIQAGQHAPRTGKLPEASQHDSERTSQSANVRTKVIEPSTWRSQVVTPLADTLDAVNCANCARCASRRFCMPDGYESRNAAMLRGVFGHQRKISRGNAIFRAGDPFRSLYVVKSGSSKTGAINNNGREQISGFQIAGEFIGMEGISTGHHGLDAVALEDSIVCCLPFDALSTLSERDAGFRSFLHKLMSQALLRESNQLMLMARLNAMERLVAFLLDLSQRYAQRGYSANEFNLRMTREEIGCHLGLTIETVSRMFSRLNSQGLIHCTGKRITLTDRAGLNNIYGNCVSE